VNGKIERRSLVIVAVTAAVLLTPLYFLRFIHPAKADAPPEIAPANFHAPVPTPAAKPFLQAVAQKVQIPLPTPTPTFSPHAQATPCQPCRENVDDYLAAIAAPFPQNRQNVYEAPQVLNVPRSLTSNAQPVPVFPNNVSPNYEFGR
jgi:hypothetical protein